MVDFISLRHDKVGPLPPAPPQGAGEIQTMLRRVNEQVGFGRLSVADGAKQFVAKRRPSWPRLTQRRLTTRPTRRTGSACPSIMTLL